MKHAGHSENGLNSFSAVMLVAGREIRTRMRAPSYIIGTLAMIAAICATVVGTAFLQDDDDDRVVAAAPGAEPYLEVLRSADGVSESTTFTEVDDAEEAEERVSGGEYALLLTVDSDGLAVVTAGPIDSDLHALLEIVVVQERAGDALVSAGVSPAQAQEILAQGLEVRDVSDQDEGVGDRLMLSLVAVGLLYVFLVVFGIYVAQGVVEEKASRIVEILLSAIRPWHLMFGKILGIGVVGMTQFLSLVSAVLATLMATDQLGSVPDTTVNVAVVTLVWFILGYFLFATMLAASGALVSRQEDVQAAVQPVLGLLAVPFAAGVYLVTRNPVDPGRGVEILSLIPPFSPVMMPLRSALEEVPLWQHATAVGLSVVLFIVLVALASRIYSNAILRTGSRIKVTEALRSQ